VGKGKVGTKVNGGEGIVALKGPKITIRKGKRLAQNVEEFVSPNTRVGGLYFRDRLGIQRS